MCVQDAERPGKDGGREQMEVKVEVRVRKR